MSRLRLYLKAERGAVSLRSFVTVVDNSLAILTDLDSAISSEPGGSLDWVVTALSLDSITVEIESKPTTDKKDYGPEVVERFVQGLAQIEKEPATPPYFSDFDLRKAQEVARVLPRNGAAMLRITDVDRRAFAEITPQVAFNAAQLVGTRYRSLGSVEGKLEMISVHRKPQFSVYHAVSLRAVKCRFDMDMLDLVKEALGRRVLVGGTVHSNARGEPTQVELDKLEILPREDELPTASHIRGLSPDFTADRETGEYIRSVRDA